MSNALDNLRQSLEKALEVIDESQLFPTQNNQNTSVFDKTNKQVDFSDTNSLLERCRSIAEQFDDTKPVIRVLHHFACSGGSLISKCLSAMPNVFLLSEVHPHSNLQYDIKKPKYSPSDVSQLAIHAGIPNHKNLAQKMFLLSIKATYEHVEELGGTLILRDHSHSDYCVGSNIEANTVSRLLEDHFEIRSIVTLRNPIDSYLSLVANGWVHFSPSTFDEYCARLLSFLSQFKSEFILYYEDLVENPKKFNEEICEKYQITFQDSFEAILDCFLVTGDSGRKGSTIRSRARREIPELMNEEVRKSEHYKEFCKKYPYYTK